MKALSKGSLNIEQDSDGMWRLYDQGVCIDTESELPKLVTRMFEHGDRLASKAQTLLHESDNLRQRVSDILVLGRQAMDRTVTEIENG